MYLFLSDNPLHGSLFLLLQGGYKQLSVIMVLHFVCISWRGQRSRGDEVLFANGTLARVLSASAASAVSLEVPRGS